MQDRSKESSPLLAASDFRVGMGGDCYPERGRTRRGAEHELTSPPVGRGGEWIAKTAGNARIPDLAITNWTELLARRGEVVAEASRTLRAALGARVELIVTTLWYRTTQQFR